VGMCAIAAGLYLLWRHRGDIAGWIAMYVAIFRRELLRRSRPGNRPETFETNPHADFRGRVPQGALAVIFAVCLILAGQAILFLDLLS